MEPGLPNFKRSALIGRSCSRNLRDAVRRKHRSLATEQAYAGWCRRFLLFHDKKHPKDMGEVEIRAFLTDLAVTRRVATSTQNQALNAIVFLYVHVLERNIPIRAIGINTPTHQDHNGGRKPPPSISCESTRALRQPDLIAHRR